MTEPYLILHKVRGEPAFDVAIKLEPFYYTDLRKDDEAKVAGETMWIIPTSGHRAYPYKWWPLTELEGDVGHGYFKAVTYEVPETLPDHYSASEPPRPRSTPKPATTTDDFLL